MCLIKLIFSFNNNLIVFQVEDLKRNKQSVNKMFLFYLALICGLRLVTLSSLRNAPGIFVRNNEGCLILDKVNEKNIGDMYVVIRDRKLLFYNNGSLHGFRLSEDNITLHLVPISMSKIQYYTQ